MSAAAHRDQQIVSSTEVDRLNHIRATSASGDESGMAVERTIPNPPRTIVVLITGEKQRTPKGRTQILDIRPCEEDLFAGSVECGNVAGDWGCGGGHEPTDRQGRGGHCGQCGAAEDSSLDHSAFPRTRHTGFGGEINACLCQQIQSWKESNSCPELPFPSFSAPRTARVRSTQVHPVSILGSAGGCASVVGSRYSVDVRTLRHARCSRDGGRLQPDCGSLRNMRSRALGGHPPKSLPSRRPGRAPPGHGGGHGRRPSAPHAGTPGNGGPASTRLAPRRADPRVPGFQFARSPPAPRRGPRDRPDFR